MRGGWRELAIVLLASTIATAILVSPIVLHPGSVGRIDNGDGQLSIWNVAWVARMLVADPRHVFDANIFYPHRWTLSYSEANLGAGILAIPAYWLSGGNPYAAHNSAVVLGFVLTATGMYYLVRKLAGDRRAAAVSAICFAYCPFVFAHQPHVQLLMTFGIPFSMLAFHRLVEQPGAGRGATLGAVMAAQAIACGYYGVFVVLMIGVGVVVVATVHRRWSDAQFWASLAIGAAVAVALALPPFLPYAWLQRDEGFARSVAEADLYSATWSTYLASPAIAHAWMLRYLAPWREVAFPGFVATVFGVAGLIVARKIRRGEVVLLYGSVAGLALWASFGPRAGLYAVLYRFLPVFSLLRASQRFALLVCFALSVLAGVAIASLLARLRGATAVGVALAVAAGVEMYVKLAVPSVEPVNPVYRTLAAQPRGAVIEMPFFYPQVGLFQHTKYMLASTAHWFPLVNGYSDYIPRDFYDHVMTLAAFPSRDALKLLEPIGVRYAVFHMYGYNAENRSDVLSRLKELAPFLRPIYIDDTTRLYEIVGSPR